MSSPYCPTTTPASTMPMICGMRSRPMMMGESSIISRTTKKISVGSVIGKYWDKFSMKVYSLVVCKFTQKL